MSGRSRGRARVRVEAEIPPPVPIATPHVATVPPPHVELPKIKARAESPSKHIPPEQAGRGRGITPTPVTTQISQGF